MIRVLGPRVTIMGEQVVQGRYAVAWGRFEPATFRSLKIKQLKANNIRWAQDLKGMHLKYNKRHMQAHCFQPQGRVALNDKTPWYT